MVPVPIRLWKVPPKRRSRDDPVDRRVSTLVCRREAILRTTLVSTTPASTTPAFLSTTPAFLSTTPAFLVVPSTRPECLGVSALAAQAPGRDLGAYRRQVVLTEVGLLQPRQSRQPRPPRRPRPLKLPRPSVVAPYLPAPWPLSPPH